MKIAEAQTRTISPISAMHYSKLFFRLGLFAAAAVAYIMSLLKKTEEIVEEIDNYPVILVIIWLVFAAEMIFRFFPSRVESMGCQKQFAVNYVPADQPAVQTQARAKSNKAALLVAAAWIALNAFIGALYLTKMISWGVLVLISLAFSVCDMICILFFCPFQTWFMKNKCCVSCRIYNWDYAMMFTPLVFIPNIYTWSIFALALALLLKWEIIYHRHPERFAEATNKSLSCAGCQEKLCQHKKSLQRFLERQIHG